MQIIDYVIIAIAVISLIVGLIRGFISQILVLLGIVAISVGTSYLFKFPMQWLSGLITNEKALSYKNSNYSVRYDNAEYAAQQFIYRFYKFNRLKRFFNEMGYNTVNNA